jgi:ribosomal-protein-alanine N-acetyltransferase
MPITADRLILRYYRESDYSPLRELDGDPEVLRFRSRKQITAEMTRASMERAYKAITETPRLYYAYAIDLREDSLWLGQCGLSVIDPQAGEAFLWYSLLPRFWGCGYMPEAVRALVHVGFSRFYLKRIFAECHPENHASLRVMQKAGLLDEGQIPFPGYPADPGDRIRYGMHVSQYDPANGATLVIEPPL